MRQMWWWSIWDSFEVCNNFGVPRGTPETCCKRRCVWRSYCGRENQIVWLTIELLKRRVCSAVNRLDVLENLNLYDITSSYVRWTHNWYFVWTYDTQRSCVVRRKIISTDGDNHCGTCYLYSSVVNDVPYELFQCSDVYVKDEPYACFDWKNWQRISYIRSISARQVWVPSEV